MWKEGLRLRGVRVELPERGGGTNTKKWTKMPKREGGGELRDILSDRRERKKEER